MSSSEPNFTYSENQIVHMTNQLFSADAAMYRNLDFLFILPMKIWKKLLSKVVCFRKIARPA